jgi:hypothetical protein
MLSQLIVQEKLNAIIQISDVKHYLSLVIHLESSGNPPLRETVQDPNEQMIATYEFSNHFLTRLETDIVRKYTVLRLEPILLHLLFLLSLHFRLVFE